MGFLDLKPAKWVPNVSKLSSPSPTKPLSPTVRGRLDRSSAPLFSSTSGRSGELRSNLVQRSLCCRKELELIGKGTAASKKGYLRSPDLQRKTEEHNGGSPGIGLDREFRSSTSCIRTSVLQYVSMGYRAYVTSKMN